MLRTQCLLAIALGVASLGSVAPASAFPHAGTMLHPVEVQGQQLPLPPRQLKVAPQYCETHNCLMPPRPGGDR
ncbi:hypothetical protein L6654_05980 [Bradyrhizobium sp. WYCCWR 13023]|uniref:Uncharacterized protein n=1 Tax=Bradyrhizobium zhengyangense TaxID=2911009 RepID=A0A9X1U8P6_9BRAD|nr:MULTISPECIES: hypothetical protein [Bradyrhizobium]MCG2626173.1 hypothetical protein [Bradyrhizobium zhengyangense]MCG2643008.1 hypothetical protein [Bradyrhizobium zhengyangense]MCG2668176.1 hypothetical protein [Bradyrhizobium zhengyangense]